MILPTWIPDGVWSVLMTTLAVIATFFHVTGLLSAAHAVWNCRTSQGSIAWGFSLILFPYLAVPAYWTLGRNKFEGYRQAFSRNKLDRARVASQLEALRDRATIDTSPLYRGFQALSDFPITSGNQAQLLIDGEETFRVLFDEIRRAKSYVYIEFFLIADDGIGREFKDLLVAKARDGVKIYFVYDELGSIGLPGAYPRELTAAGVKIFPFYPARFLPPYHGAKRNLRSLLAGRFQFNLRNHRKITVVDGKVALAGGVNVHDASLGRSKFYGPWRDTHLRLEGPAVAAIQLAFLDDYGWASSGQIPEELEFVATPPTEGGMDALYLASGPADDIEAGKLFFLHCIQSAKKRIWMATPYFIPPHSVLDALKAAALRGVEVKIIIPLRWDLLVMYLAAFSYLPEAEAAGMEIYRYSAGHPHQKVMLIDDEVAWVGSSNLDARSMLLNFEGNCVVFGSEFAGQVEEMLKHDFARCQPLGKRDYERRSLLFKLGVKLCRLFEPIL